MHAGDRISIQLTLSNHNRFLPVFYPCLTIQAAGRVRPQSFHYPAFIRPRQTVSIPAHPVVVQRGRQNLTLLGWTLLFPFALHETQAKCRIQSGDFIVWPAKVRIDTRALLPSSKERIEHRSQGVKPRPDRSDPTSYREYNRGDSRRAINWKLSAKVNRLMVAESQPGAPRRISLILELSDSLWTSRPRFERMLSMITAAAIALHRQGRLEAVYIDGYRFSQGQRADLNRLLDALAICELRRPRPMEIPDRVLSAALRIVPSAPHGIALVPALSRQTARVRAAASAPHRL